MPMNPIAEIRSSRLREFVAYLGSKRNDERPLQRSDVDPITDAPRLAPYMMLVERTADGRHRIRLVGTKAASIIGRDYTGHWMDEIGMGASADWYGEMEIVFSSHEIFAGHIQLPWNERAHVAIEWVAQKFAPRPGVNDMTFLAFDRIES